MPSDELATHTYENSQPHAIWPSGAPTSSFGPLSLPPVVPVVPAESDSDAEPLVVGAAPVVGSCVVAVVGDAVVIDVDPLALALAAVSSPQAVRAEHSSRRRDGPGEDLMSPRYHPGERQGQVRTFGELHTCTVSATRGAGEPRRAQPHGWPLGNSSAILRPRNSFSSRWSSNSLSRSDSGTPRNTAMPRIMYTSAGSRTPSASAALIA